MLNKFKEIFPTSDKIKRKTCNHKWVHRTIIQKSDGNYYRMLCTKCGKVELKPTNKR